MLLLKKPAVQALILVILSWILSWAGIVLGDNFVAPGDGFPMPTEVQADLFRFDSVYYKSIAENSYEYNGDPFSSPNIVFAPLFSILAKVVSWLPGLDVVSAGFVVNFLLLSIGVTFLILFLTPLLGHQNSLVVLFAMLSSAGSYSFHAYYSESSMVFCLSLALLSWERRWLAIGGLAVGLLGASRLAALPMTLSFAVLFWLRASNQPLWQRVLITMLCLSGVAGYLGYLGWNFGQPFELLDTVQKASWGRFHSEANWLSLLSGGYVWDYFLDALDKGWATVWDIQTLNLVWMSLAAASCLYVLVKWPKGILTAVFVPYFFFVYYSNVTSPYLISSHRLFVMMLPIYIMLMSSVLFLRKKSLTWLANVLAAFLLLLNIGYGLLHTAMFNQGIWFWF